MRAEIAVAVKESNSLSEVRESLFAVFRSFRDRGHMQIGYVAGAITSDGPDKIQANIERLAKFTKHLRAKHNFPIFSATDVFDEDLFSRLNAAGFTNPDWEVFWREVLGTEEKFITDIFMTPRWEKSHGATDEYKTAQSVGINIYILTEEI